MGAHSGGIVYAMPRINRGRGRFSTAYSYQPTPGGLVNDNREAPYYSRGMGGLMGGNSLYQSGKQSSGIGSFGNGSYEWNRRMWFICQAELVERVGIGMKLYQFDR